MGGYHNHNNHNNQHNNKKKKKKKKNKNKIKNKKEKKKKNHYNYYNGIEVDMATDHFICKNTFESQDKFAQKQGIPKSNG